MSKCMPKDNSFILEMERMLNGLNFVRDAKVYYDAGEYSKRDYVADITLYYDNHFCSEDMVYLKELMRDIGATAIIGCKRKALARTYLDLAFDKKVRA